MSMRRYQFFRRGDQVSSKWHRFYDTDEAIRFLRSATADFDTLHDLRRWAKKQDSTPRQDVDLLKYAAAHLVSGDLRITTFPLEFRASYGGGPTEETPAEPEVSEIPTRSGARITPSALRTPKSNAPPKTAPSQPAVDIDKQIATLLAAAKNGATFCEQCQKANAGAAK